MSLKMLLTFILFHLITTCLGQSNHRRPKEELVKELKKKLPDTTRQKLYNDLGKLFLSQSRRKNADIDSAIYYFRKSVYLTDSTSPLNNEINNEWLCLLADTYFLAEKPAEGKKIFMQVISNYQRKGDKTKEAETWFRQGEILLTKEMDFDSVESSFNRAINLYIQTGNIIKKIDVAHKLAYFHFRMGYSAVAEKEFQNLITESKKNRAYKLSTLYYSLSVVKRYAGDFNQGLTYALNAIKIMDQTNDTADAHNIYGELALEYQELDQPEKSVYWYKKCIAQRIKKNINQYSIYRTTYLMIVQMIKIGKEKEALEILENLERSNPPNGPTINAILAQSLAYCYNKLGRFVIAEKYFVGMIKDYSIEERNEEVLFIANCDIGQFYVSRNEFGKAEPFLQKAFASVLVTTITRVKDLHLLMFKVDSANSNYIKGIEHFQMYKALNDSIVNKAKSKQIEELQIQYETEKKEQNISLLEQDSKVQQSKLKQSGYTRNWMLGGVFLLIIIVGLLYSRSRLIQQTNKKLKIQQIEIREQNIALQHLVKEKEWLVKEIHHRVKNNLHTIIGLLDTQSGFLKTEEALLAISDSQHRVQAMSLIHQKLFQSEDLSTIGISGYIHELVDYLKHSFDTGQRIRFELDIDNLDFSLSHSLPIGLILNEAITNSIKYAFSANSDGLISISLKQLKAHHYLLAIADNGKGLPAGFDYRKCSSMGMSLMFGLSEDIQGDFSITNKKGTEIKISFMYDPSNDNYLEPPSFS